METTADIFPVLAKVMSILLLGGAALLTAALFLVRKLTRELPKGANRNWWYVLAGFLLLFLSGYVGFLCLKAGSLYTHSEMLVVMIFLLGAVFCLMVCLLAYRTTLELKRIYILEHEAMTDPLMGIYNRRVLDRRLRDEVMRAKRHHLDLGLLMVDLDRFKSVNDTYGHHAGDLVLQHVARLLIESLRQTDVVARYGGEEITILLPHTPPSETCDVAERLRRTIAGTPVTVTDHQGGKTELTVTVSIGCASLLPAHDTPESLLQRADQGMYQAKQQGRNKVVRFDAPQEAAAV
ncbi:GGDEF domain-containing protein [Geomonas oryzae]|uniref:GGDEF domain-containing protein n=1 Tax=Geomonas oryzae TaxID=2364273 RepID=UPI00100B0385|nr:diguanylate cyclase [Geomonas oryzae]